MDSEQGGARSRKTKGGVELSKLKCLATNVDSILNKRAEFAHILVNKNPDILLISEILPKNFDNKCINKAELSFTNLGYDCFTNCLTMMYTLV